MSSRWTSGHAALMDDVYRHQRYIYDLTRKYYLFGRDRLIAELALKPDARVVEVGCGTARNLVQIARRYPSARLYGLDASEQMLETAQQAIARAGLMQRTRLVQGYAEALSPAMFGETAPFDAVIFSYSLSMIPDWKQALSAACETLGDDGMLEIVDFGDLRGLGSLTEALLRRWLGLFHVSPRGELLRSFETGPFQAFSGRLRLLPGRYTFMISIPARERRAFASAVAGASHAGGNSVLRAALDRQSLDPPRDFPA